MQQCTSKMTLTSGQAACRTGGWQQAGPEPGSVCGRWQAWALCLLGARVVAGLGPVPSGCVSGGRPMPYPWRVRGCQQVGPVPDGPAGSSRPGPCAWRACGIDRQAWRLCRGGALVFEIFELLGCFGQPAVPGWPGRPARACTGLVRPWAGGWLGLAVSGHVTGSKGSRSCITDLKKSERKGKVP